MTLLAEKPIRKISPSDVSGCPRGQILMRVLEVLDRENIPYCLLHGYADYPQNISGDVDCLIPAKFLPSRLGQILHAHREEIGARVVQWFQDDAHFIVLAARDLDDRPILLQLHVSTRYEMAGRMFFDAATILDSRRREREFWVPATDVEFACILANRLAKADLTEAHAARLTYLYQLDPPGCSGQAMRLLPTSASDVMSAGQSGNWQPVIREMGKVGTELLATTPVLKEPRLPRLLQKIRRWVAPKNGYHAVFLGPDGVGKSTTIEAFQRDLAPAFLHTRYLTFAPSLLPQKFAPPKPDGPHSLPPRSYPASLLKAAWWLVCYTLGYYSSIHADLARCGMVVNHRYLVDAIVDQKRYRYSGPTWLLRLIWRISPKPDVVFLLSAPPELIQRRKQEVTFEETAEQLRRYRAEIVRLPMGKLVDASQSRDAVAAEVEWFVLDKMAERFARQVSPGDLA